MGEKEGGQGEREERKEIGRKKGNRRNDRGEREKFWQKRSYCPASLFSSALFFGSTAVPFVNSVFKGLHVKKNKPETMETNGIIYIV